MRKRGELPVELLATVRIGPLLFAMLFYPVAMIVALVLRVPGEVRSTLTCGGLVVFMLASVRVLDARLKAGPATAWFRPRRMKAWISVDDDYLTVIGVGNVEVFVPTRIEWTGSDSFVVVSGKARFRVLFGRSDEATDMLSKIQQSFPQGRSCNCVAEYLGVS